MYVQNIRWPLSTETGALEAMLRQGASASRCFQWVMFVWIWPISGHLLLSGSLRLPGGRRSLFLSKCLHPDMESETCEFVMLLGQGELRLQMELRLLISWFHGGLSRWTQCDHKGHYKWKGAASEKGRAVPCEDSTLLLLALEMEWRPQGKDGRQAPVAANSKERDSF